MQAPIQRRRPDPVRRPRAGKADGEPLSLATRRELLLALSQFFPLRLDRTRRVSRLISMAELLLPILALRSLSLPRAWAV